MTRDNTAGQAARRQSIEGRPEKKIEKTFYVIFELLPEPWDQRMCGRKSERRQREKIILPICWNIYKCSLKFKWHCLHYLPHWYWLDGEEHVSGLPVVDCHHGDVTDHGDPGGGGDQGDLPGARHRDGGLSEQPRPHTDPALGLVTLLKRYKILSSLRTNTSSPRPYPPVLYLLSQNHEVIGLGLTIKSPSASSGHNWVWDGAAQVWWRCWSNLSHPCPLGC